MVNIGDSLCAYESSLHERHVAQKLEEAEVQVGDSSTQWLSHGEIFSEINEKYGI